MVKLEYAIDKNKKLVHINDFLREAKNELMPFYCRLCYKENNEFKEVIAKKGNIRRHHFALKNHNHAPETIVHSNAIDKIYFLLKSHLEKNEPFYAGINLDIEHNSQSINTNRKIQRINVLRNISDVVYEERLENGRQPDISLKNNDGKVIRVIEIVVSNAPDENKIKDLKDIEIIEVKIEPSEWIEAKLYPEKDIKFIVNKNEIHNPLLPVCDELIRGTEFCINDNQKRLPCFVGSDIKYSIFDFEDCPTYIGDIDKRCSYQLDSGNKCNRMLLKNENEYCENCIKEKKYKEEQERNNKLLKDSAKDKKTIYETLENDRKERNNFVKPPSIIKPELTPASVISKKIIKSGTLKIIDLDLPETVKKFYLDSTITALYPPQADAIKAGLLEGKNIVAAIPTASGKTLLAEFAMLRSIMAGGKALYIVPLRALASEKYDRFRTFGSITKPDGRNISTGIATGDLDSKDEFLGRDDIIVATSEKVDSLLRNRANWLDEITVIIADEVHLIDSPDRGPTLEIVLAKLMRNHPQVIALSATIGNANEIAKWLGAELVLSEWRPIDLKEGVFFGNAITFKDSQRTIKKLHSDSTLSLAADTLIEGGQCLVFESSRRNTEGMAARIGTAISSLIDTETRQKLALLADALRESSEVDTAKKLAQCVQNGSAFHHAGLISEQRKIIEDGFRSGTIKVITATPTLAAGLNMPARRVIIKGYMRYDTNFGMKPIPVLEYKQMAGRAGRPGLDPYGESVLVAKNYDELEELMENYVSASAEDVWSKLGTENALRTHILSTIATGFASSMEELLEFMGATFYSYQQEPWSLRAVIEKVIIFLVEKKMILEKHGLFPTELGGIVSRLYIDPLSASIIIEGMEKIEKKDIAFTELTLLQLVSSTPDLRSLYLRSKDSEWLGEFAAEHHAEFVHVPRQSSTDYEWFLSDVKTACVMLDWINEVKEEDIVTKFGIGEGDIRALAENTKWLVHSMAELGKFLKLSSTQKAQELVQRLEYGASPELLELIQIRGIGRVRARKLYNAGYRDIEALRESDPKKIAQLIGTKTAIKILKLIGAPIPDSIDAVIESREQAGQRRLGDFR